MTKPRTLRARICLLSMLAACALAAPQPNLSGTWKLNLSESDFSKTNGVRDPTSQLFAPQSMTLTISQQGDNLKFKMERIFPKGPITFDVDLMIGGQEHNSNAAGLIRAAWKADSLEVTSVYNPNRARSERRETWTLSPDGRKLIDDMVFRSAEGQEAKVRRVFDKE